MWYDKHFGRHFLTCLRNAWTCFNETYHNYLLPNPLDSDDIFKVMGSMHVFGGGTPIQLAFSHKLKAKTRIIIITITIIVYMLVYRYQ